MAIGQAAVVQHLEQQVKHLRVGLLDLVEEHHAVGAPPHGLGELAALLVAHVARRRPDHAGHGVPLLVLAHVQPHHGLLVVEQELGQGAGQLGLAHTRGAQEDKAADGPVGVLKARASATHGIGHGLHRLVLVHHPLVQSLLHVHQLLDLALQQPGDGDARPAGDHLGDVLGVYLLLEEALSLAQFLEPLLLLAQLPLQLAQRAVAQAGRGLQVGPPLGLLDLQLGGLDPLFGGSDGLDGLLFLLPLGPQTGGLLPQVGQLPLQLLQALLGGLVRLLLEGLPLDLQLHDFPVNLVQLGGLGIYLRAQLGSGLVNQVNGLVGQVTVRDVAVGEGGSGDGGCVGDAHPVMHLWPICPTDCVVSHIILHSC